VAWPTAPIEANRDTGLIPFTVGDAETAAGSLTVTALSSNPSLLPASGVVLGGSGAARTVKLTPAANQTGGATVTLTVSDGSLSSSTSFELTVNAPLTAPTLSDLTNRVINAGASTGPISFTIGHATTPVTSLIVTGTSSNTVLVPVTALVFGGADAQRTLTVTPAAGQTGTATITVVVNDGALSTSDSFVLTVNALNTAPTITSLANLSINANTSSGGLAFTVGDTGTAASPSSSPVPEGLSDQRANQTDSRGAATRPASDRSHEQLQLLQERQLSGAGEVPHWFAGASPGAWFV
jgi:hypothetical protein